MADRTPVSEKTLHNRLKRHRSDIMARPMANVTESAVRWRTANACRRCRQRKVKCSGEVPCQNCANRHQACVFDEVDRKLVISERYLRELQRRHVKAPNNHPHQVASQVPPSETTGDASQQPQQSDSATHIAVQHPSPAPYPRSSASGASDYGRSERVVANNQSTRHREGRNNNAFTWAFSQEIRQIFEQASGPRPAPPKEREVLSYDIPAPNELEPDSSVDLPPRDHIIHLAHIVDFHLNVNRSLFNCSGLLEQIKRVNPDSAQALPRLCQVRLLMVIALGKLFLGHGASRSGPPGIREFLLAVQNLPTDMVLWEDPLTAVEATCLLAFYAQQADILNTAYIYVGHASRIARCSRFNEDPPGSHEQKLWLTVCTLDKRLSASLGVCSDHTIQDQREIRLNDATLQGEEGSEFTLLFNLAIANSLTRIMIDKSHGDTDSLLMNEIKEELVALRGLGKAIGKGPQLCHGSSIFTISRTVATLHLSYYHCLIIASKPVLGYFIRLRHHQHNPLASETAPSEHALNILGTCVNAARNSLSIISALHEQHIIETFLSMDLEVTFLAGLALVLANIIIPNMIDPSLAEISKDVLQKMSHKGNIPASALKDELDDICRLTSNLDSLLRSTSYPPILRKTFSLMRDGKALSNGILEAVENKADVMNTTFGPIFSRTEATDRPMRSQPEPQTMQRSGQIGSWVLSPLPESSNIMQTGETLVDYSDTAQGQFNLDDMLSLQWLDSVQ